MRAAKALRRVQGAFHPDVLAVERPLVAPLAGPHAQAGLDGLLEQLEALGERRERQAEALGLLRVVPGADAEHRPAAREDVERRHDLGEQAGVAVRHGGRERQ